MRLQEMYLDKLDGRVSAAFYDRKSAEWRHEQSGCRRPSKTTARPTGPTSTPASDSWSWPAAPTNCS